MDYLLEIQILAFLVFFVCLFLYLWKQGRKERGNPRDYLRHIKISVYMLWKQIFVYIWKEERNRNSPCGLSMTDTDSCVNICLRH